MKTITLDFSTYEHELLVVENNGEGRIITLINEAKRLGVIQFEYEELKAKVQQARDSDNRFRAGELYRKGLL